MADKAGALGWRGREELTKSEQSCEWLRKCKRFTYVHTQRSGGQSSLSGTHISESDGHTPLSEALDEEMKWNKRAKPLNGYLFAFFYCDYIAPDDMR